MIQRTYNCALKAVKDRNKIIIATDSIKFTITLEISMQK